MKFVTFITTLLLFESEAFAPSTGNARHLSSTIGKCRITTRRVTGLLRYNCLSLFSRKRDWHCRCAIVNASRFGGGPGDTILKAHDHMYRCGYYYGPFHSTSSLGCDIWETWYCWDAEMLNRLTAMEKKATICWKRSWWKMSKDFLGTLSSEQKCRH